MATKPTAEASSSKAKQVPSAPVVKIEDPPKQSQAVKSSKSKKRVIASDDEEEEGAAAGQASGSRVEATSSQMRAADADAMAAMMDMDMDVDLDGHLKSEQTNASDTSPAGAKGVGKTAAKADGGGAKTGEKRKRVLVKETYMNEKGYMGEPPLLDVFFLQELIRVHSVKRRVEGRGGLRSRSRSRKRTTAQERSGAKESSYKHCIWCYCSFLSSVFRFGRAIGRQETSRQAAGWFQACCWERGSEEGRAEYAGWLLQEEISRGCMAVHGDRWLRFKHNVHRYYETRPGCLLTKRNLDCCYSQGQ